MECHVPECRVCNREGHCEVLGCLTGPTSRAPALLAPPSLPSPTPPTPAPPPWFYGPASSRLGALTWPSGTQAADIQLLTTQRSVANSLTACVLPVRGLQTKVPDEASCWSLCSQTR